MGNAEKFVMPFNKMADALERIANNGSSDSDVLLTMLDGTKSTYDRVMRSWFIKNGAKTATESEFNALVDEWYNITRTRWIGGIEYNQPTVSTISTGTKFGDNGTLRCTPSTDTVKGVDDYEGLPLFAVKDCNWKLDSDGNIIITAIDGISLSFERNNPEKYVGVLQMSCYYIEEENEKTYKRGISSEPVYNYNVCKPIPESVKLDGTIRSWVCHTKYQAGEVNNKMTSCSGQFVKVTNISHNSCQSLFTRNGSQYGGTSHCDIDFLELMKEVKYGLASDGILQGCVSYYFSTTASLSENNVRRVLLTSNPGFIVGSTVKLIDSTDSFDRNATGLGNFIVSSIENVTISGTNYIAINLYGKPFNTTAGTTQIGTMPWSTGSTDNVLGNDGSMVSNTNGIYPCKIQGIEYMLGTYEVVADTILKYSEEGCSKYIVSKNSKKSTSITSDYIKEGTIPAVSASNWYYILKMSRSGNNAFAPTNLNGSSSTGHRDAYYILNSTSGNYEFLAFGGLRHGSGAAGLSCASCAVGLSNAYWGVGSRLSCNVSRGEVA